MVTTTAPVGSSWNGWKVALISHSAPPISASASTARTRRPPRPRGAPAGRRPLPRGAAADVPRAARRQLRRRFTGLLAPVPRALLRRRARGSGTSHSTASSSSTHSGWNSWVACGNGSSGMTSRSGSGSGSSSNHEPSVTGSGSGSGAPAPGVRVRRGTGPRWARARLGRPRVAGEERLRGRSGLAATSGAFGGGPGALFRAALRVCRLATRHVLLPHCGGATGLKRSDPRTPASLGRTGSSARRR